MDPSALTPTTFPSEGYSFPISLPYLGYSLNSRVHWSVRNARSQIVRNLSCKWARMTLNADLKRIHTGQVPVKLHYSVLWPKGERRRDVDNLVGMLKPVTDGLVDALVVYKDTPDYLTGISVEQGRWAGPAVIVTVYVTPSCDPRLSGAQSMISEAEANA